MLRYFSCRKTEIHRIQNTYLRQLAPGRVDRAVHLVLIDYSHRNTAAFAPQACKQKIVTQQHMQLPTCQAVDARIEARVEDVVPRTHAALTIEADVGVVDDGFERLRTKHVKKHANEKAHQQVACGNRSCARNQRQKGRGCVCGDEFSQHLGVRPVNVNRGNRNGLRSCEHREMTSFCTEFACFTFEKRESGRAEERRIWAAMRTIRTDSQNEWIPAVGDDRRGGARLFCVVHLCSHGAVSAKKQQRRRNQTRKTAARVPASGQQQIRALNQRASVYIRPVSQRRATVRVVHRVWHENSVWGIAHSGAAEETRQHSERAAHFCKETVSAPHSRDTHEGQQTNDVWVTKMDRNAISTARISKKRKGARNRYKSVRVRNDES